jgi:hypothetical protein
MKRKGKDACVLTLSEREVYCLIRGLACWICQSHTPQGRRNMTLAEARALARRLAKLYATLAD